MEWSQEPIDEYAHLLEEAHQAALRSGVHQLIVATDGVLLGHRNQQDGMAEGLEHSKASKAYALQHAPRTLSSWAILPGMWAAHWVGDTEFLDTLVEDCFRTTGPTGSMSHNLALVTRATWNVGRGSPPAEVLADTSVLVDRLRDSGANHWLVCALNLHAYALTHAGDHAAARRAVAEARALTPPTGWLYARGGLCWAAAELDTADPAESLAEIGDVLTTSHVMGWLVGWVPHCLAMAARSLLALERREDAARILALSDRITDDLGVVNASYTPGFHDQVRAAIRAAMTEHDFEAATMAGASLAMPEALAIIRATPANVDHS